MRLIISRVPDKKQKFNFEHFSTHYYINVYKLDLGLETWTVYAIDLYSNDILTEK